MARKKSREREVLDGISSDGFDIPMKEGFSTAEHDRLKSESNQPKHYELANAILDEGFAIVGGMPCIPNNGRFEFGWDAVQRAMLRIDPCCTNRTRNEAIQTLKYTGPEVAVASYRYIEFENGVLDVSTLDFMTSDEFMEKNVGIVPVVIPHKYDPEAQPCEAVETLLEGVSCGDEAVRTNIEEFIGLSMSRYTDNRSKAVWGYGGGENGKSTLWDAVSFVVGDDNTCSLELEDYKGQFNTQMLVGKLLAVSDDQISCSVDKAVIGKIKKIVTGQPIRIEQKGRDPYNATMFCTIFVASNEPPQLSDTTHGSLRRWHMIPLNANFKKRGSGRDIDLKEKLHTEEAAQWLIKLGIDGLRRVLENEGMTETDYSQIAIQEAKERSNSVYAFLADHPRSEFLVHPNVEVWYWRYQADVRAKGGRPFEQTKFTQMVNTEYGFTTKNNGRYKNGEYDLTVNGLAREHGRNAGDRYRVFIDKQ